MFDQNGKQIKSSLIYDTNASNQVDTLLSSSRSLLLTSRISKFTNSIASNNDFDYQFAKKLMENKVEEMKTNKLN